MKLKLYNRDEIFLLDLDRVLYFKAEDHYSSVYYSKDTKQLLPFGLSQLESLIAEQSADGIRFLRAGRSHLLNFKRLVHVSVAKESVTMLGYGELLVTIHVSRCVAKDIARSMRNEGEEDGGTCAGGGKNAFLAEAKSRRTPLRCRSRVEATTILHIKNSTVLYAPFARIVSNQFFSFGKKKWKKQKIVFVLTFFFKSLFHLIESPNPMARV